MTSISTENSRKQKHRDPERTEDKKDTKKKRKLHHEDETPAEAQFTHDTDASQSNRNVASSAPIDLTIGEDTLRISSPPPPPALRPSALAHLPSSSPYFLITASKYLSISPAYSKTPELGIKKDHLDPIDLKYDAALNGVVLFTQNIRFTSTTAKVMYDSPFAMAWVDVEFIVWRPERGMVLDGWVNNASPSHVGLLHANMFSVSVNTTASEKGESARIPSDWTWEEEGWRDGEGMVVEGLMRFVVVGTRSDNGMLSIEGSFVPSGVVKTDDVLMKDGRDTIVDLTNRKTGDDSDERARRKAEKLTKKAEKERKRKGKEKSREKST